MRKDDGEPEKDLAKTYDEFKSFEGRRYTGMKVGGRHKRHYDKGEMTGLKYKLAHKRAGSEKWSASDRALRRRLARILIEMARELQESEPAAALSDGDAA